MSTWDRDMEMALMQHSTQTSGAQTSQRPNGGAQTAVPKCHIPKKLLETRSAQIQISGISYNCSIWYKIMLIMSQFSAGNFKLSYALRSPIL